MSLVPNFRSVFIASVISSILAMPRDIIKKFKVMNVHGSAAAASTLGHSRAAGKPGLCARGFVTSIESADVRRSFIN